jgi:catechol 2,3-dioxygenase-like lactoylglutathione lyase family enzyme
MDQRISYMTLGVADLARSRAFYAALGFTESKKSNANIAFFEMPGVVFALYARAALAEDAHQPDDGAPKGFHGVALAQNQRTKTDVDKALAAAVRAGATLLKPAHDTFWGGYAGYFADPDGFAWEVAYNPRWPMDGNGRLQGT